MIGGGDRLPIEARAVLLDGRGAALVADDGTVDWWSPDGLGAAPAAWRLLDPAGGALRVGPVGPSGRPPQRGRQRWSTSESPAVVTRFETTTGVVEVTDVLVRPTGAPGDGRLLRIVDCMGGEVEVEVSIAPGRRWVRSARVSCFDGGVAFDGLALRAPGFAFAAAPVTPGSDAPGAHATALLRAGDRRWVVVGPERRVGAGPTSADVRDLLERSVQSAQVLAGEVRSSGRWAPAVRRSTLVLWGLTTDGWLARSATTSLPSKPGVERTVDGRHAWLVDAAAAVPALVDLGLEDLASSIARRLGDVLRDGGPMTPARRLDGARPDPAQEHRELAGRGRTQPVLEGLGDEAALEADDRSTMAALIDVAAATHARSWPAAAELAVRLADGWDEPDAGLWDLARSAEPLVAPKVATWQALLAARDEERRTDLLSLDAATWHAAAVEVAAELTTAITATGWLPMTTSGDLARTADAALLRLVGMDPSPVDPRIAAFTLDAVLAQCSDGAFVRPYPEEAPDGRPTGDSPQLAPSFDAVRALAVLGRWEEAHERMDALIGWSEQRLGVLSRSVDPVSGASLGNVPDAPAHLSLIAAAAALDAGPA